MPQLTPLDCSWLEDSSSNSAWTNSTPETRRSTEKSMMSQRTPTRRDDPSSPSWTWDSSEPPSETEFSVPSREPPTEDSTFLTTTRDSPDSPRKRTRSPTTPRPTETESSVNTLTTTWPSSKRPESKPSRTNSQSGVKLLTRYLDYFNFRLELNQLRSSTRRSMLKSRRTQTELRRQPTLSLRETTPSS